MNPPDGAPLYPVGLVVAGRRCLVVGGGRVAGRKIDSLLRCRAAVTVVAPAVHEAMAVLAQSGAIAAVVGPPLDVQIRPYERGEAAAYRLVVTATGDPAIDGAVHADAEAAGVWVNSADDTEHCTFMLPAVHRDGPVSVAVSTGGTSPALAGWLRGQVAAHLPPHVGELARLMGEARSRLRAHGVSTESVRWHEVLDGPVPELVADGHLDGARAALRAVVDEAIERSSER
jgi:siroheme synthase-like protein